MCGSEMDDFGQIRTRRTYDGEDSLEGTKEVQGSWRKAVVVLHSGPPSCVRTKDYRGWT